MARREGGGAGQCFIGYEKHDLLWNGRKIAGAAQRRNKLGLLIQGSVQPPPISLERASWEEAMQLVAVDLFHAGWEDLGPDAALRSAAEALFSTKYSAVAHNQKR